MRRVWRRRTARHPEITKGDVTHDVTEGAEFTEGEQAFRAGDRVWDPADGAWGVVCQRGGPPDGLGSWVAPYLTVVFQDGPEHLLDGVLEARLRLVPPGGGVQALAFAIAARKFTEARLRPGPSGGGAA